MHTQRVVQNASKIIEAYDYSVSLHRFLPLFYKDHKYMGSRDRRQASALVYHYFRLGNAFPNQPLEARLALADFLCSESFSPIYADYFKVPRSEKTFTLQQRLQFLTGAFKDFNLLDIFPLKDNLSPSLNKFEFIQSLAIQPALFIRIHPDVNAEWLFGELKNREIEFKKLPGCRNTLKFKNGTKLDEIWALGMEEFNVSPFEIQDFASQQTGEFINPMPDEYWWDSCAGAGGKSLMLKSKCPDFTLLATDVRKSILKNYEARMDRSGFGRYTTKVVDLKKGTPFEVKENQFDGIIADVPCSGSGTWGRSPENMINAKEKEISEFAELQFSLVKEMVPYLKPGKPLFYITCSVFEMENEDVVDKLIQNTSLTLDSMRLIKGYADNADNLFIAKLINQP
ncbi:MAG: 16S rRNA (cytosine967-C5)-methyltransferase [Sphingobacteriales bacterium]|jgi:16S rRNA (cytosine967-C5)-methyltransferase